MDKDDYGRLIPGSGHNVTLGSASVQSTAVGEQTYAVRIVSTGACHVDVGPNPIATAASALIAANRVGEFFKVQPGDKVAVIQDGSATGTCNIIEMTR